VAVPIALAFFGVASGTGYLVLQQVRPGLAKPSFLLPVLAHYWDAATSSTALAMTSLPYWRVEKHILATNFIGFFKSMGLSGPVGMFAMKTLLVVPAVYYLDREFEGERRRYYLFLVALLGLALGTRNLLSAATL
ncbi:MAG: DUF63 family protein, partial [Candidatus Nanohaloarchaea archaeon]